MLLNQHTCQPRQDILQGSFNPESFTTSLSQVADHYRGKPAVTHALYTDAEQIFRDATYATEGLRMVLSDVFSRLAGEHSAPALYRLETAFGGGKTHTLIALTHLGFRGRKLAPVTQDIIGPHLLHAPDEVTVVGIAGDEIPVYKPQGSDLAPYTLWGELAYQIGGEAVYRQVETAATSPAAPDRRFIEHILEGHKVVIRLDELAQYAARLEAARPHGSEQLAAFLLALLGYARTHAGIAVVLTLASQSDAFALAAGQSRAQLAYQKNPHPAGFPLFEYTWKTVFFHSLLGRVEGLGSILCGIGERDALFEVAFPGLTPPQIEIALHEIEHSAYYLGFRQGRYYGSLEPSIPRALAGIRNDLRGEEIWSLLDAMARKVVDKRTPTFQVEHDVSAPEHVPDKANKPVLALIALGSDEIDVERFVTTAGPNRPRLQQNLVFLLVPETVHVKGEQWTEDRVVRAQEVRNHWEDTARTVLAMRQLKERPENHGITATMLREQNFETTLAEREHALVTTVSQAYDRVWFPSASGQLVDREIKTAGGEGGAPVIERIRETLSEAGELITADKATTHETLLSLSRLLLETIQTPTVVSLREQFACQRRWPVLEEATMLESIMRAGVEQGHWCLFRMGSAEEVRPEHCFSRESGALPLALDLTAPWWSLVTTQMARQRGWLGSTTADPSTVERWVAGAIAEEGATYVAQVVQRVQAQHGEVPQRDPPGGRATRGTKRPRHDLWGTAGAVRPPS